MFTFPSDPPKPDWELWSHKRQACLWEAVAVSLDIEPGHSANTINAGNRKTEYTRRLRLSVDDLGGGLRVIDPSPKVNNRDPAYTTIDLFEFSWLAKKMNWDLPEQFPGRLVDIVSDDGRNASLGTVIDGKRMVRTPAGKYVPEEQWRAMTTPIREPGPPEVVMATTLRNDGAPIPAGPLVPNTTRKKPEWDLWGSIPDAFLWAAVALSCDIHPDTIDVMNLGTSDLAQFTKRFIIAVANVRSGTLATVEKEIPTARLPDTAIVVNLTKFCRWAQGLSYPWELPSEFPRSKNADPPKTAQSVVVSNLVQPSQPESASTNETTAQPKQTTDLAENTRETLLTIIAGAIGENIENQSTAAKTIERRLEKWGIDSPKHRQILNWLNEAKRVLDGRKEKD